MLDVLCVIVITLILSYFTLILGELVPKRIAMKNPEKAAMRLCSVVRFFAVIFRPIVWFLSVSTNLVLKMLRIDPKHQDEEVTEEEIEAFEDLIEDYRNTNNLLLISNYYK